MKRISVCAPSVYVKLASLIRRGKVSVIAGAGISTSSGIPDFRSKTGIFSQIKRTHRCTGEDIFTRSVIYSCSESMNVFIEMLCTLKERIDSAVPSETHKLFAYLCRKHKANIYTQNIDGLEKKAGVKKKIIYLHGNLDKLICTYCSYLLEYTREINEELRKIKTIECPKCIERRKEKENAQKRPTPVGRLLPNIVLYGDQINTLPIAKKVFQGKDVEVLLVIGTSLRVYGVKNLVKEISKFTFNNKGIRVYIGKEKPPKSISSYFDYWIEGDCNFFSERLLSALKGTYLLQGLQRLSIEREEEVLCAMRRLSLDPAFRVGRAE